MDKKKKKKNCACAYVIIIYVQFILSYWLVLVLLSDFNNPIWNLLNLYRAVLLLLHSKTLRRYKVFVALASSHIYTYIYIQVHVGGTLWCELSQLDPVCTIVLQCT